MGFVKGAAKRFSSDLFLQKKKKKKTVLLGKRLAQWLVSAMWKD